MKVSKPCKWLSVLTIISVPLFFGLFFGLNYPEIVRTTYIHTTCTIHSSSLVSRYCCEKTSCATNTCASIPNGGGVGKCDDLINGYNQNFKPDVCNSGGGQSGNGSVAACPPEGGLCNGGYYCCERCCDVCRSCSTTCSTPAGSKQSSCSTNCNNYSCNCRCCLQTSSLSCRITCPTCYSVQLIVSYPTHPKQSKQQSVVVSNVTYEQNFGKDQDAAKRFLGKYEVESSDNEQAPKERDISCWYNPQDNSQVLLSITYTPWKWAVSSVFGIVPLALTILLMLYFLLLKPCWRKWRGESQGNSDPGLVTSDELGARPGWGPGWLFRSRASRGVGDSQPNGKEKESDTNTTSSNPDSSPSPPADPRGLVEDEDSRQLRLDADEIMKEVSEKLSMERRRAGAVPDAPPEYDNVPK